MRRAYNLIEWVMIITISVAIAGFIGESILKRGLQSKVEKTTDYVLWKRWGVSMPDEKSRDNPSRGRVNAVDNQNNKEVVKKGLFTEKSSNVSHSEKSVMSFSAEGSETMLGNLSLNQFNLKP